MLDGGEFSASPSVCFTPVGQEDKMVLRAGLVVVTQTVISAPTGNQTPVHSSSSQKCY
jgi:hypothetical protein